MLSILFSHSTVPTGHASLLTESTPIAMKNSIVVKIVLGLAGLMFTGVGIATLFAPDSLAAGHGFELTGNVNLAHDFRSAGGLLIGGGLLMLAGIVMRSLTYTSTVVASVLYLAFGLARVVAIAMDGMPADSLVKATVVELIVGVASLIVLLKYRER